MFLSDTTSETMPDVSSKSLLINSLVQEDKCEQSSTFSTTTDGSPGFEDLHSLYVTRVVVTTTTIPLIIISNSITLFVLFNSKCLRSNSGIFVISLMSADVIYGFLGIPKIMASIANDWPYSQTSCLIIGYFTIATLSTTVWSTMAISIDR